MKKIILILCTFLIGSKVLALNANSYIVLDKNNGRVIDGENIHRKGLIASTTKIMTALIVIENMDLNETVTIHDEIKLIEGSSLYLKEDEEIKVMDLLYGLILRSGNDAAISLAYNYSGNEEKFVQLMNEYAKKLKMKDTIFYTVSGLENNQGVGNISTVYDMAILTKYATNNPILNQIMNTKIYNTKTNFHNYTWKNKNKLLFSSKYVIGGKTGYTKKARRTLVTYSNNLIIITFNDPNDFKDHEFLYKKFDKILKNNDVCNENIQELKKMYLNFGYEIEDINCPNYYKKSELKKVNIASKVYLNPKNSIVGEINIKIKNRDFITVPVYEKGKNNIVVK